MNLLFLIGKNNMGISKDCSPQLLPRFVNTPLQLYRVGLDNVSLLILSKTTRVYKYFLYFNLVVTLSILGSFNLVLTLSFCIITSLSLSYHMRPFYFLSLSLSSPNIA